MRSVPLGLDRFDPDLGVLTVIGEQGSTFMHQLKLRIHTNNPSHLASRVKRVLLMYQDIQHLQPTQHEVKDT